MPKLKVFRTSIGFHDAYVAAPSRAAALRAWGADTDLFAMGAAEVVTDSKLTARPLKEPGKVIRASRGSALEHLDALTTAARRTKSKVAVSAESARPRRLKPRPSRSKLDEAESALETADQAHETALAALDKEIKKLRCEREDLERRHQMDRSRIAKRARAARDWYEAALRKWRDSMT